ncbi:MAG: TlpA disulfide reductase family protein [Caldicoprobacterales bacterium]
MKRLSRLILILVVFSILMIVISTRQQNKINVPDEDGNTNISDENEAIAQENNDNSNDTHNSEEASVDNTDDSRDDNSNDSSDNNYEDLDINPKVSLKENVDYLTIDKPLIDFELEDLNGNKIKLSDYKGQIVFLNFWATWCPPCRAEMPDMEAIHQEYGDKGVVILGVSSTELELRGGNDKEKARQQVQEYIDNEGFTFSIPLDSDNKAVREYNAIYPMIGIPTTYMIDREGIIRYVRSGAFQGEKQLKAFIALLNE